MITHFPHVDAGERCERNGCVKTGAAPIGPPRKSLLAGTLDARGARNREWALRLADVA
jgi:hypothetical protein